MRSFHNPFKNIAYFGYRIISPILSFNILSIIKYITYYIPSYIKYILQSNEKVRLFDIFPQLNNSGSNHELDYHYLYQSHFLAHALGKEKPKLHTDIGSQLNLIGPLSAVTSIHYYDIRKVNLLFENVTFFQGDGTRLPIKDQSISSLSSLHVIEHIGLGRYGDQLDTHGSKKMCKELQRVLKKKGKLYLSTPVGRQKVYFNAHRVHQPHTIIDFFDELDLQEMKMVTERGEIITFTKKNIPQKLKSNYNLGFFIFERK